MTTAQEIIDRALFPMRDTAVAYFDAGTELLGFVNDAIIDLCARERLLRKTSTILVSGGVLALPATLIQARWLKDPDDNDVGWMDESTFFEYQRTIPSDTSWYIATVYNDEVHLHPTPADGAAFVLGYFAIPPKMTALGDTIPLRNLWDERIMRYVRSECYARLGDLQLAALDKAAYEKGLRPAQAIADHQVPGRINFAIEPNLFDLDSESIHRGQ